MGEALVLGLLRAGVHEASEVVVVETDAQRRAALLDRLGPVAVVEAPVRCEASVLAVKPGQVDVACAALAEVGTERVLSIAAGVTTAALERKLGAGVSVVRAMPNTPALVGRGAAAVAAGSTAGDEDVMWATRLLEAVGVVVRVPESSLDAVTGLSGSGPAYVFLLAEALIEAGVLVGLSRADSVTLTEATLLGAATLLAESTEGPEALRAAVTSPAGTTAAGLAVLEERGMRAAVAAAVVAATQRSRALGGPPP